MPKSTNIQWRKSSYSGDQGGSCVECAPLGPLAWRTSTYSGDQGGDCVECAPVGALGWQKSTYSSDQGGECVEVAGTPCAAVAVRDSKNPAGPSISFSPDAFRTFVRGGLVSRP
ncbi:DUF397 domain-containing protein [Streptomyces kunmingensis]|uniref:DUF397 domain-containing protein n=1 Tax=Streptomyces kunmingensis TaxID=68225 RepID=A0ABU6C7D8_9ACTN|nr:DUF397 domain-containing protein [Streptomyces kunmingensis]MEB3959765.1 DUF397 domain-containing protein [Streptomyces kunmingensis]